MGFSGRRSLWLLVGSACLLLLLAMAVSPGARAQVHRIARVAGLEPQPRPLVVHDRMRPMRLTDLSGNSLTIGPNAKGTIVYNVFATWCPPCRAETPDIARASAELAKHGIQFMGIDQGEPAGSVTAFARANALQYPIAVDTDRSSNAVFGANIIPMTVVVRDGVVQAMIHGPVTADELVRIAENG